MSAIEVLRCSRWLLPALLTVSATGQRWHALQGTTTSGDVALRQALLDAGSDALVLLVASHPDDRYVLPAAWLRYVQGVRCAVLLATRGGGGQNSLGPESGDALARIRTLEIEAGCWQLGVDAYYLDRPDHGYRRTAEETFAEWGRQETLAALTRMLRTIRPEVVLTTHHLEETHGHDLALAELLPQAVVDAGDSAVDVGVAPHQIKALFMGATSQPARPPVTIRTDLFEPVRGATLRRLAHSVLLENHVSPGAPAPMDTMFGVESAYVAVPLPGRLLPTELTGPLGSLFDADHWSFNPEEAARLDTLLGRDLPRLRLDPLVLIEQATAAIRYISRLELVADSEADRRRQRRIEALQRVVLHASSIRIEVEPRPGAVAVAGEQLDLLMRAHAGGPVGVDAIRVESDHALTQLQPIGRDSTRLSAGDHLQATVTYHVPLAGAPGSASSKDRFRGDRYEPAVQLRFLVSVAGIELPLAVVVPVDLRPPVELSVVPSMLLLPASRQAVRFTVQVERNSAFAVQGRLDLRAPAGYRVEGQRNEVELTSVHGDIFEFALRAPARRKSGVDTVSIRLGASSVSLPVHKVHAEIDPALRIGIVRSRDDALSSAIGAGGFGLRWAELSDLDLAVGDLDRFDTIVVDVRALRGRPEARRSFRRLLEFSRKRGHRLVVLYHKDTEFEPPGEGFQGAPLQPFQIGRSRVTRADAPVQVLRPDHVLLHVPNEIQPRDWDGWGQERALYLPSAYADAYEEIVSMHDPGLPAERSGLLYLRQDEGEFVYCALALWRQWKKLHPGSIRMLANLLTPCQLPE
jgi:LmbE family N-acetylglucosaminyl deacetylase